MSTAGLPGPVSSVARTTMRVASTWSTTPERRATMVTPESRGATPPPPRAAPRAPAPHPEARGVDLVDDAGAARNDGDAGVAGDHLLHAGADQRRIGTQQRHGLA